MQRQSQSEILKVEKQSNESQSEMGDIGEELKKQRQLNREEKAESER